MKKHFVFALSLLLCLLLAGCAKSSPSVEFHSFEDLSGKKVGIQAGTLYEDYLYEKVSDAEVEFFSDPNTMLVSLSLGKLDAYVTDSAAFIEEARQYPELQFIEEPLALTPVGIGIGNTARSKTLEGQINEFIAACEADGTFDHLQEYWIDNYSEDNAADRSGITGENGTLVVDMESAYIPMSYMREGEAEGYDVDFIYRFCRAYGYTPEFELTEYDALSPALASGKCDLATNILYDEEREEAVALSDAYYTPKLVVGYFGSESASSFSLGSIAESFEKTFIREARWKQFADGALVSLLIASLSIVLGTLCGLLAYVYCRRGGKLANKLADKLSWLVEGTPAVLLLMIFYFIIFGSVDIEKIIVAIITFSIVFTVSMFAMLQSGERAVGPGQREAALAQGFSESGAYFHIVLPQSAIHFLPQYCGEVVSLIKETSIVGYIAILDLTKVSDMIRGRTFEPFFPLISTAVIYFLLSWLLTVGVKRLYKSLCPATRNLSKAFKDIL